MNSCVIALRGRAQYISEPFNWEETLPNSRKQFSQKLAPFLYNLVPKYNLCTKYCEFN